MSLFREGDRREAEQWLSIQLDRTIILFDRAWNGDSNGGLIVDNVDNGGHSVHFVENWKFWTGFAAGDDFLGVALVDYIDKRSIFGFETTINQYSSMRAF